MIFTFFIFRFYAFIVITNCSLSNLTFFTNEHCQAGCKKIVSLIIRGVGDLPSHSIHAQHQAPACFFREDEHGLESKVVIKNNFIFFVKLPVCRASAKLQLTVWGFAFGGEIMHES